MDANQEDIIRTICSICHAVKTPGPPEPVSHGLCLICSQNHYGVLTSRRKRTMAKKRKIRAKILFNSFNTGV